MSVIKLKVIEESSINLSVGEVTEIHDRLPDYDGSYEVTPLAYESQTLETANRSMTADVTVLEIPIYEVSNEFGTTINIGG